MTTAPFGNLNNVLSMTTDVDLISALYTALNARDIEFILRAMDPEVNWPNDLHGGRVSGHDGVLRYWIEQWLLIDAKLEPRKIELMPDGTIDVEVRQVLRDLQDSFVLDQVIRHVYELKDGRVMRMDTEPGAVQWFKWLAQGGFAPLFPHRRH